MHLIAIDGRDWSKLAICKKGGVGDKWAGDAGDFVNLCLPAPQLTFFKGVQDTMKLKINKSLLALAAGSLIFVGASAAQTVTPPPPSTSPNASAGPGVMDPGHPRVNEVNGREANQQQRIANGIQSGKLSPQEASNLEKREASVQRQEQHDMAEHGGHLTKGEQNRLNQRQNNISKSIHKDKHK
jgi:hypothetical protein